MDDTARKWCANLEQRMNNGYEDSIEYSTEERLTGKWIDGRPLYKKTIIISSNDLQVGVNNLPHNIENFDFAVSVDAPVYSASKSFYQQPRLQVVSYNGNSDIEGQYAFTFYMASKTDLRIGKGSFVSNMEMYITIVYTKTIN